ncbi:MAG: hypothetical protein ACLVMF_11520 [Christensenellales bacterium]
MLFFRSRDTVSVQAPENGLPAVRLKRWLNLSKVSVPREFQQKLPVQGAVSGKRRSAFRICSRFQQGSQPRRFHIKIFPLTLLIITPVYYSRRPRKKQHWLAAGCHMWIPA